MTAPIMQDEKKQFVRRVGILFSLGLLPLMMQFVASYLSSVLLMFFPDFCKNNSFWVNMGIIQPVYVLLYTVPIVLIASSAFKKPAKSFFESKQASPLDTVAYIFIFLGSSMLISNISSVVEMIINNISGNDVIADYTQLISMPEGFVQTVVFLLVTVMLPAICEELVIRGVFCGSLLCFDEKAAVFLSALMFGLFHYTLSQMPFAFVIGLLLGYIYAKTQSFWLVSALHFLNNSLSAILLLLYGKIPDELLSSIYSFILFIAVCGGIFFLILLVRKSRQQPKLPAVKKTMLKYAFTSPMLWVTVVLSLAFTLMTNFFLIGG